jgi:general secretion pathway protein A
MYEAFFELEKLPFSMTPDPAFLFMTPQHREAMAGLTFALASRRGFLVLTGEAGTGKTTLLRRMLTSAPASRTHFGFVLNPMLSPAEFLELVLIDFGVRDVPASKAQRLVKFEEFLLKAQAEGKTAVLVVDEAHKLTLELLEEIRLLTNFETSEQKLLQIILAGQPELSSLLNREDMRQLKQRVAIRLHLNPLQPSDVEQYIRTRWIRAGSTMALPFTAEAIHMITGASRGIPRLINVICDNALTNAFGECSHTIDGPQILEVLGDLHIPVPANGSKPAAAMAAAVPVAAAPGVEAPAPAEAVAEVRMDGAVPAFRALERYMPEPQRNGRTWWSWLGFSRGQG